MNSPKDIDVLVLAAGFGTRLRPLTLTTPKPLIEVAGIPLLERTLNLLCANGFKRIFVNAHYLSAQIESFIEENSSKWPAQVIVVKEDTILGTGGAVKNVAPSVATPNLLILNSDVVLDRDFTFDNLLETHAKSEALATLMLRDDAKKAEYGTLGVDSSGRICSFLGEHLIQGSEVEDYFMFSGLSIIRMELSDAMPKDEDSFSLTQTCYRNALSENKILQSIVYQGYWNDVGTHSRLEQANKHFS